MAYQKKLAGRTGGKGRGAQLYYAEILADVWGLEPYRPIHHTTSYSTAYGSISKGDYDYGWHFSKWHLGKKYNAAMASLSRAIKRLDQRGLVTAWRGRSWAGICLTEAGAELAEKLLVNTAKNFADT